MEPEYDPLEALEEEIEGRPEGSALLSVDDFYDLLMEQQEQM